MGTYRPLPGPRCCYGKLRLTPEEAAARFDRYPDPNTNIYICNECGGWLHYGHEPVRIRKAVHHAILSYKETRYRASVKRQQNTLRKPAWMNDSRLALSRKWTFGETNEQVRREH
jgi:hypothetical protein